MLWLSEVAERITEAFRNGEYIHDAHAFLQQEARGIDDYLVEEAVGFDAPEIISNHPKYWQGPAVLIRGIAKHRILHIFCTIDQPPLFVTTYRPDKRIWYAGFRKKRKVTK